MTSPVAIAPKMLLDLVLPPRCAGCGDIVGAVGDFCATCFTSIDWAGGQSCRRCALPLEATEEGECGGCLANPGPIEATFAATLYGDISRSCVMRLKYGRRVGLARTMARAMSRRLDLEQLDEALLVPVPLHRWRIWKRGYNQAGLLAREVGARTGLECSTGACLRIKATRPLKQMSVRQRRETVRGAFRANSGLVEGRTIILVDDVRTSGGTLEACATALRRGGAKRVEALVWARVVR